MIPRGRENPLRLQDSDTGDDVDTNLGNTRAPEVNANCQGLDEAPSIRRKLRRKTKELNKNYSYEELLFTIYQEIGENSLKKTRFFEALERYMKEWERRSTLSIKEHGEDSSESSNSNIKNHFYPSSLPSLKGFLLNTLSSMKCLRRENELAPLSRISSWDRYSQDFEEICMLGEGGFGRVYKARHRLDSEEYALKKVQLSFVSSAEYEFLLKEVKLLSKLKHPNIAQYFFSWIQLDYAMTKSKMTDELYSSRMGAGCGYTSLDSMCDNGWRSDNHLRIETKSFVSSSSIIFAHDKRSDCDSEAISEAEKFRRPSAPNQSITSESLEDSFHQLNIKFDYSNSDRKAQHHLTHSGTSYQFYRRSNNNNNSSRLSYRSDPGKYSNLNVVPFNPEISPALTVPTLYIQMELAGDSLLTWIERRNEKWRCKNFTWTKLELRWHLRVFKEILLALKYIHSKGIVHMDIKPANILISLDDSRVMLTDFGLAKHFLVSELKSKTLWESGGERFSSWVGTPTYCAPEITKGNIYDTNVDIYSLGIILLEFVHPFSSMFERASAIEELKYKRKLDPLLASKWGYCSHLMLAMTEKDPKHRPTASEILLQIETLTGVSSGANPSPNPPFVNTQTRKQEKQQTTKYRNVRRPSRNFSNSFLVTKIISTKRTKRFEKLNRNWVGNHFKSNLWKRKDNKIKRLKVRIKVLERRIEELEKLE